VPNQEKYEITRDFEMEVNGTSIVVPRFFRYDGASIPAIAWQIIHTPFNPQVMGPAVIHDWLYYNHQTERKLADDILADLLSENGIASGTKYAMWAAVRTAGDLYWDNDEADEKELIRICRKVFGSKNFSKYCFPENIVNICTG